MSNLGMESHDPPTFELGEDETGGPAFFWANPWTGKREKIANLWWPTHPPEATDKVEHIFEHLQLVYAPDPPKDPPMTDTPTDKKLSERFGGFDSAEQQERAVFMDAFDAADSKLFAKGVAAGIAALDKLRALRLYESRPSAATEIVAVRRSQLLAVLQCRHVAEGMSDDQALEAARRGVISMSVAHPSAIRARGE